MPKPHAPPAPAPRLAASAAIARAPWVHEGDSPGARAIARGDSPPPQAQRPVSRPRLWVFATYRSPLRPDLRRVPSVCRPSAVRVPPVCRQGAAKVLPVCRQFLRRTGKRRRGHQSRNQSHRNRRQTPRRADEGPKKTEPEPQQRPGPSGLSNMFRIRSPYFCMPHSRCLTLCPCLRLGAPGRPRRRAGWRRQPPTCRPRRRRPGWQPTQPLQNRRYLTFVSSGVHHGPTQEGPPQPQRRSPPKGCPPSQHRLPLSCHVERPEDRCRGEEDAAGHGLHISSNSPPPGAAPMMLILGSWSSISFQAQGTGTSRGGCRDELRYSFGPRSVLAAPLPPAHSTPP